MLKGRKEKTLNFNKQKTCYFFCKITFEFCEMFIEFFTPLLMVVKTYTTHSLYIYIFYNSAKQYSINIKVKHFSNINIYSFCCFILFGNFSIGIMLWTRTSPFVCLSTKTSLFNLLNHFSYSIVKPTSTEHSRVELYLLEDYKILFSAQCTTNSK